MIACRHSAAHNFSDRTRKVVFFGYSYRWLRGLDYNSMPDWLLSQCDPIQRQLLGDNASVKGHWQPSEEDVPLKGFLDSHRDSQYAVSDPMIYASVGEQGGIEGVLKPILGEWAKM